MSYHCTELTRRVLAPVSENEFDGSGKVLAAFLDRLALAVGAGNLWTIADDPISIPLVYGRELVPHESDFKTRSTRLAAPEAQRNLLELDLRDKQAGHGLVPLRGKVVKGEPEGLGFTRMQGSGFLPRNHGGFSGDFQTVGLAKDAIDLHQAHGSIAVVGDLAFDHDNRVFEKALFGLHLDIAQIQKIEIEPGVLG